MLHVSAKAKEAPNRQQKYRRHTWFVDKFPRFCSNSEDLELIYGNTSQRDPCFAMGNSEEKLNFASHQTLACARSLLRRHHCGPSPAPSTASSMVMMTFLSFPKAMLVLISLLYSFLLLLRTEGHAYQSTDPPSTNRDMHTDPPSTNRFRFIYRFRLSCTFSGISHAMKLFLRQKR